MLRGTVRTDLPMLAVALRFKASSFTLHPPTHLTTSPFAHGRHQNSARFDISQPVLLHQGYCPLRTVAISARSYGRTVTRIAFTFC